MDNDNGEMKQISFNDTQDVNDTRVNISAALSSDGDWKTIDPDALYDKEKYDLTKYDLSTIYRMLEYVRRGVDVFFTMLV